MAASQKTKPAFGHRTLSLDPRSRRVGFCCFHKLHLIDWGTKNLRVGSLATRVRQLSVAHAVELLDRYRPDVVVLPRVGPGGTRRSDSATVAIDGIKREAASRGIVVVSVSNSDVQRFSASLSPGEKINKQRTHVWIAGAYPELRRYLPRPRKLWEPEAYVTPMLDSAVMFATWRGLLSEQGREV